jgi:hypothetical protein
VADDLGVRGTLFENREECSGPTHGAASRVTAWRRQPQAHVADATQQRGKLQRS